VNGQGCANISQTAPLQKRGVLLNRLVYLPIRFAFSVAAAVAVVMALAPAALLAQQPATPPAGAPQLPARPVRLPGALPPGAPVSAQPLPGQPSQPQPSQPQPVAVAPQALPAYGENEMIPFIDFPNTDIRQVLEFYEKLTGKKALYDSTVQGNIRVRVTKPVARVEAVRILETVFSLNNFTLIPGPGDIVKVINQGKNVRQFSIPIFSEADQLPAGGQVATFLFKLDYADPAEVKAALDQVIAPTPSVTSIVALPKSQAVLVTEGVGAITWSSAALTSAGSA